MHSSFVILCAVVFFKWELPRVEANPPPSNSINFTPGIIGDIAGAEIPVATKKFVPALFFKTNWFRAYQYCRFHGMYLASTESQDEEKQLMSAMEKSGLDTKGLSVWTSGADLASEGDFAWMSSGKIMTYKNWGPSEPNGGSGENCVALFNGSTGYYWDDRSCHSTYFHFACEYFGNNINNLATSGRQLEAEYV